MDRVTQLRGELFANIRRLQERMAKRQALQDADAESVADLKALLAGMTTTQEGPNP